MAVAVQPSVTMRVLVQELVPVAQLLALLWFVEVSARV
jgi:hypothetical protein